MKNILVSGGAGSGIPTILLDDDADDRIWNATGSMYLRALDNMHLEASDGIWLCPDRDGTTGGDVKIFQYATTNQYATFDGSTQRLGIGTTSPSNKLHVLSTTTPQARVAYDGTYYMTTEVSSVGSTTWTNQKSFRFFRSGCGMGEYT